MAMRNVFGVGSWRYALGVSLACMALGLGNARSEESARERLLNDTSLSLYIPFDEHADADISESSVAVSPLGTSSFGPGVVGNAISFAETGDGSVRYSVVNSFDAEKGTFMFWFKPQWHQASGEGKYTLAWITMKDSQKYFAFHRSFNDDPQATFVNFHWDNSLQAPSRLLFAQDEWTHFAVTWNADQRQYALYRNGELLLDKPWNPLDGSQYIPQTLQLGKFYPTDNPINGAYDDVMLFKRALSPQEIQDYYQQTRPQ